jgi:hypothetical protein
MVNNFGFLRQQRNGRTEALALFTRAITIIMDLV